MNKFFASVFIGTVIIFVLTSIISWLICYFNGSGFYNIGWPYVYYAEFQSHGSDYKNSGWDAYGLVYELIFSISISIIAVLFYNLFKNGVTSKQRR